jgi:phosphoribosylformylglycinamidine cyclo-ligase
MTASAYGRAGVDRRRSSAAVAGLVDVLRAIDPGRAARAVPLPGHYAAVLRMDERTGLALSTDGVGTKVIVAERLGRYDTVGIDCVAMNANDLVCVGAEPLALLDYLAVEEADPERLRAIGEGLRRGAEEAGVEIPGGELAQLPELIRGHPSPGGFDLVGTCVGLVALDALVTGARVEPGDAVVGLPSSGIHANGLSLARRVLPHLGERPPELGGSTVGEALLEPTRIYVRAVRELLGSGLDVRGLAHITGDGLLNLLRLEAPVGWSIHAPLPVPGVFELVRARMEGDPAELWEVLNMGCGFCCVVPDEEAGAAVALLERRHPGAAVIGRATHHAGRVELPGLDLVGTRERGFATRPPTGAR